jgi:hypothetical protein
MPRAVFLFLAGVTLAFLMDSHERKGASAGSLISAVLSRAGFPGMMRSASSRGQFSWLSESELLVNYIAGCCSEPG